MKAIILAAGRGSRMKDMTDEKPKCLVTLRGRSLLDWQLSTLHTAGIQEIAIVTGYRRECLIDRGLVEFYNERWAETNMVSSLGCASEWLLHEPCIVCYSDIFFDASAVEILMDSKADLTITYDPNWRVLWERRFGDPLLDAETFRLNKDGTLAEIGHKPKTIEEIQGQYMGLLRLTPQAWIEISHIRNELSANLSDKMHMTGTLQKVIDAGRMVVQAVPYLGQWGEVDSEDDLAAYN